MIGKLRVECAAMDVRHVSHRLSQTDQLDADCLLSMEGGLTYGFIARFPQTYVRQQQSIRHWLVDSCPVGIPSEFPSVLRLDLMVDPEVCIITSEPDDWFFMQVEAAQVQGTLVLPDGQVGRVSGKLPKCRSHITGLFPMVWTVDPVTADLQVEFQ